MNILRICAKSHPQSTLKLMKLMACLWVSMAGLKTCMSNGYSYIEGMDELLLSLKQNNYEIHAFTNYPIWYDGSSSLVISYLLFVSVFQNFLYCRYQLIEDKLKLSKYLSWTFCSCTNGILHNLTFYFRLSSLSPIIDVPLMLILFFYLLLPKDNRDKLIIVLVSCWSYCLISNSWVWNFNNFAMLTLYAKRSIYNVFQERESLIRNSIRKFWGILKLIHRTVFSLMTGSYS